MNNLTLSLSGRSLNSDFLCSFLFCQKEDAEFMRKNNKYLREKVTKTKDYAKKN